MPLTCWYGLVLAHFAVLTRGCSSGSVGVWVGVSSDWWSAACAEAEWCSSLSSFPRSWLVLGASHWERRLLTGCPSPRGDRRRSTTVAWRPSGAGSTRRRRESCWRLTSRPVCIGPRFHGITNPSPPKTLLTPPHPHHRETPPTSKPRSPPLTCSTPPSLSPTRAMTKTRRTPPKQGVAAAANQVRWSCRRPGSRTATSRPPPCLITASLSRRPLRASPALFLTASSCLARSSRQSTTPTVQPPPFLPNRAPCPQEAIKVELERGVRLATAPSKAPAPASHSLIFIFYPLLYGLVLLSSWFILFSVERCRALSLPPSTFSLFYMFVQIYLFFSFFLSSSHHCVSFYMWKFAPPLSLSSSSSKSGSVFHVFHCRFIWTPLVPQ